VFVNFYGDGNIINKSLSCEVALRENNKMVSEINLKSRSKKAMLFIFRPAIVAFAYIGIVSSTHIRV
jgi:hypothetical protein